MVWDVNERKIYFTQTIHRRPLETRWIKDYVLGVNCIPWRFKAGGQDEYGLSKPVKIVQMERGEVPKVKPFA